MKTERVMYRDLRLKAMYYQVDPVRWNKQWPEIKGTEDEPPLWYSEVFTCYEGWLRENPWLYPPPRSDNSDRYAAARAFFGSADEWLR